ncbi:hypothetical protein M409DRAFT_30214 [Zasmidium cellare ATCC 36951]|uniref:R3H-associated N-terminal domain-containing protein n=1 Tax=Zasmidium cellare ATCC 36951 TaxID=1080233 RepID=A0A6A6BX28_ZASCE|nr:uncharacterized protein M409DRAFT_30214 [Zasmidium cellare ATCC 36951]KAF2159337.1 hypothetical protein M409DRAFT_30214 [Zasmidium cellare ATCC 36951]
MAIHPELSTEPQQPTSIERVEAWTVSQAADALSRASISATSPPPARGTTVTIDIPLDDDAMREEAPRRRPEAVHTVYKRREPIRRDSLKRREALLKGKEGSRQRRRWENDRLLNNPYAEPPLPSDWQVQPTYPVRQMPYSIAPLWEAEYARLAKDRQKRAEAAKVPTCKREADAAKVKQELKAKLKKSKGAKCLLQDLEEEVREFVRQWEEKQKEMENDGLIDPSSSEDEEIVFVGRNGAMSDERRREKQQHTLEKDKLIFQGLLDDHGSAFGRYLVHAIAAYYGLKTYSITTGDPARREAYVGLKIDPKTRRPSLAMSEMPKPLYAAV